MYPHIIIAAAIEPEAVKLSKQLRKRGIFTKTSNLDSILKLKEPPALIIVLSKTYSSKAYAALLYAKSCLTGTKTFLIGYASDYTNADIDSHASYTLVDKDDCISNGVARILKHNFAFAERHKVVSDMSDTPFVYFRGTRLLLTDTEAQIVHMLASFDEACVPIGKIASYESIHERSIPSYVSSINKKAHTLTGETMIFSFRKKGYSLFPTNP